MAVFCQPDCCNQIGSQARFENIATGSHFEHGATRIFIPLNREENNLRGRLGFDQAFGRFDSVENGHRNVEHNNIRTQLSRGANGRFPVRYHTNDFAAIRG